MCRWGMCLLTCGLTALTHAFHRKVPVRVPVPVPHWLAPYTYAYTYAYTYTYTYAYTDPKREVAPVLGTGHAYAHA